MSALSLDAGAVWAGNEAIKELAELRADLADSRLIAREQENAHVAANMRNTHLEERISALAAELADWKRMRNEAMAQATFNRNEIDALAASVDRLTSDKARLAAELAAEQESNTFLNNLHKVDADRIKTLEAALRAVRDARLDWAMVCPCSCDACDRFYESVRVATSAETFAEPGIGPIEPEPQDYKVQCRCGWMGQVSALKSLPEFKMGCPDCSAEFVPFNRMTFPVKTAVCICSSDKTFQATPGCTYCGRPVDIVGGVNHEGNCAGLKRVDINQLQHDVLTNRIRDLEKLLDRANETLDYAGFSRIDCSTPQRD